MAQPQPEKTLAGIASRYVDADNSRIAFLNACISTQEMRDALSAAKLVHCVQSGRAQYLELEQSGYDVRPDLTQNDAKYDICLILIGKFRQLNEQMISCATSLVNENGLIIVSGAKNTGISSLLKRTAEYYAIEERYNKFHALAYSMRNSKSPMDREPNTGFISTPAPGRNYKTAPGVFSAGKIDPGSQLLVKHFENRITGKVADLGAGWGYLSGEVISRERDITSIDMYESNWQAIELCKLNVVDNTNRIILGHHWHDVTREKISKKFNTVIMNPPFHQGRDTNMELGQKFIETAAQILKPGGLLLMVANRQLAYEKILRRVFQNTELLEETKLFKIILAKN